MFFCCFYLFFKTCMNLQECLPIVNVSLNTFHDNNETRSRWCVCVCICVCEGGGSWGGGLLGGPAPWPVLIRVQSTDQALDALQLVGGVLLRASFWGHGNRAGGYGGRVAGHLRCGIQGDSWHRARRHDAVPFHLGPAAGHGGHGGGEQRAVRYRHGEGVRAVPESGAHRVQERVPVHRRGRSGRGRRGCCHVRVGVGEQTAKRRHGDALWRKGESECELQCWRSDTWYYHTARCAVKTHREKQRDVAFTHGGELLHPKPLRRGTNA